jgi:hypothetical protein
MNLLSLRLAPLQPSEYILENPALPIWRLFPARIVAELPKIAELSCRLEPDVVINREALLPEAKPDDRMNKD